MSEQTFRRSNWSATDSVRMPPMDGNAALRAEDDAFAELARIVGRGDPFSPTNARRQEPVLEAPEDAAPPSPPAAQAESRDDLFGVDEAAFEAALRGTIPPVSTTPFDPATAPENVVALARHRPEQTAPAEAPRVDVRLPDIADDPPTSVTTRTAVATPRDLGLDETFLRELDRELFGDPQPADPVGPAPWRDAEPLADADIPPEPASETVDQGPAPAPVKSGFAGGMTTVAAVLGLVVLGAGGAVGYTWFTGGARSGEPVVVRADNRPTRIAAEPTETPPDANKIIYDRVATQSNPASERVVPREEQPVAQPRVILPGGPVANLPPATAVPEPRRVATTTIRVRPDGTLETDPPRSPPVNGSQAAAPPATSASPPAAATVSQPATSQPNAPLVQAPAPAPQRTAPAPTAQAQRVEPVAPAPRPATPPPTPRAEQPRPVAAQTPPAPTRAPTATPGTGAPLQLAPPAGRTTVASLQAPAPTTTGTTAPAAPGGGFFVQVSSQRSEAAARQAFADLQRRFPNLLGGRNPNIRSAEVGDRGTFYRARVGGFSREEASAFCGRLRAAGGDCVIAGN